MERMLSRKRSRANTEMGKFFTTIEQIRVLIQDLETHVGDVKRKQSEILAIPVVNDNRNKELEDINSKITSLSQIIRSKLRGIDKGINDSETKIAKDEDLLLEVDGVGPGDVEMSTSPSAYSVNISSRRRSSASGGRYIPVTLRIKKTQLATMSKYYAEVMSDYKVQQVNYKEQIRARLRRQLEISKKTSVTEAMIEDMMDRGKLTAFTKSIIFDPKMTEDILSRHNDLQKLEKSIRDINDLFKELAQHVELQGGTVNSIEQSVNDAVEYTMDGLGKTKKAYDYRKSYHKKKVILMTTGGVVVTVLVSILIIIVCFKYA